MEREVGGGIGMGNTCKPMAVSFQCMTKSTTIKIIIIKKMKKKSSVKRIQSCMLICIMYSHSYINILQCISLCDTTSHEKWLERYSLILSNEFGRV